MWYPQLWPRAFVQHEHACDFGPMQGSACHLPYQKQTRRHLVAPLIGMIGLLTALWTSVPCASRACEFGGICVSRPPHLELKRRGSCFPGQLSLDSTSGSLTLRPKRGPESRSFQAGALLQACACAYLQDDGGDARQLPQMDVSIC